MKRNLRLLTLIFICFFRVTQATALIEPVLLTCEYLENPLGIDMQKPRFAWHLVSGERNQLQSAYEILVSDNENSCRLLAGNTWQPGKVTSGRSFQIAYDGAVLRPFTKYFWRVKVYDKNGIASGWSTIATFETAAMQAGDWHAKWIGDGSNQYTKDEDFYQEDPMPLFKKQIRVGKKISAARLYISGLGYSEIYINNQKVGDHVLDPGFTSYRKQALYVTYDISRLLKGQSVNTVGIMLGNGWFNPLPLRLFGRFNLRDVQQTGRPCVKAQLLIRYTDGSSETIVTDDTWDTAPGPVVRNNVYLGEEYDARLEKNFTDESGWKKATVTNGPDGILTPQLQPPIRITKVIAAVSIHQAGKDTFIVDMGQNFAGVARIKIKGPAGTAISLRYGEAIHPDGSLNWMTTVAGHIKEMWHLGGGPGAPKTAWQKDAYILKGTGLEQWNPRFTFHGFRYVEITGWPGVPTIGDLEGLRMNTDLQQQGIFSCSNDMFNLLHQKIQWTFLSNVFSVQSDCPAREKMGYGADIVAVAGAFLYNYNMAAFYTKTIRDFANDQQPDGGLTEIAPYTGIADRGYGGESGPLGWQLAFCYLQKKMYDYYDDKRIIEEQYPAFQKQMAFLKSKARDNLFYWDIGDHEALDPKAESFSASSFYYHHALFASQFAGILDKKDDSLTYSKLANDIKEAIIKKYWIPKTGRFDNATQAAQIFALWYNLSPEEDKTFEVLLNEYARHNWHLSTGIFSTMMMFDVLSNRGKNDIAYKISNQRDFPGWGHMLANGATTLWESWEKPESSSMNHPMFGSVDEWFYKHLAGINAAAPGFKKIMIKPQPAELTWVKGSYQCIYGEIKSEWKKNKDGSQLQVTIPVNTTAEIWVPRAENESVRETGLNTSVAAIKTSKEEKGYSIFTVGSGIYHFTASSGK